MRLGRRWQQGLPTGQQLAFGYGKTALLVGEPPPQNRLQTAQSSPWSCKRGSMPGGRGPLLGSACLYQSLDALITPLDGGSGPSGSATSRLGRKSCTRLCKCSNRASFSSLGTHIPDHRQRAPCRPRLTAGCSAGPQHKEGWCGVPGGATQAGQPPPHSRLPALGQQWALEHTGAGTGQELATEDWKSWKPAWPTPQF